MANAGLFGFGFFTGDYLTYAFSGAISRISLKISEDFADRMMSRTDKILSNFTGR